MASSAKDATRDSKEVLNALEERSLHRLQELSMRPGGFRDARQEAWTFLLGVEKAAVLQQTSTRPDSGQKASPSEFCTQSATLSTPPGLEGPSDVSVDHDMSQLSDSGMSESSHPDEHQVGLDTNRSFILYPVEKTPTINRKSLQTSLHKVILGVLQKRPKLRYFQGYHDIITVLFLTLPLEVVIPSAEKLSLHRLRDSMGSGLEPLVGQLRILKRLLRLIDPPYAEILERNSPLPYYALSNLLTLFSHDVPTLPLVQHVFDWLFCHEPIAVVWLAAAVILSRKQDILALEREGDEAMGMMHAVLSALPSLSDDEPSTPNVESGHSVLAEVPDPLCSIHENAGDFVDEKEDIVFEKTASEMSEFGQTSTESKLSNQGTDTEDEKTRMSFEEYAESDGGDTKDSLLDSWTEDMPRAASPSIAPVNDSALQQDCGTVELEQVLLEIDEDYRPGTPEDDFESSPPTPSHSRTLPGGYKEKEPAPPLPLSVLLRQASELLVTYPPSYPPLLLTETFGPQSVLYPSNSPPTVCFADLNDDEAEECVGGDNVVLPPTQEELEEESGPPRKPRNPDHTPRPGRKRGRPISLAKSMVVRRQTVVAGVVLLLGVAVALYGIGPGGRGHTRNNAGFGRLGLGGERWVAAWVGGLLGVGQRLGVGI